MAQDGTIAKLTSDSARHLDTGGHRDWHRVVSEDGRSLEWRCRLHLCGARFPNRIRLVKHRIKIHNMTEDDADIPRRRLHRKLIQKPGGKLSRSSGKRRREGSFSEHGKKELDHEDNSQEDMEAYDKEQQNVSPEQNGRESSLLWLSRKGSEPAKDSESLQVSKMRHINFSSVEAPKEIDESSQNPSSKVRHTNFSSIEAPKEIDESSQNPSSKVVVSTQGNMIEDAQILECRHCKEREENEDVGRKFICQYKLHFECFKESLLASKRFVKEFAKQKKELAKWKKKRDETQEKLDRLQHELKQLHETNVTRSEVEQKYLRVQEEHFAFVCGMIDDYDAVVEQIRLCIECGKAVAKESVKNKEDHHSLWALEECKKAAEMARVKADSVLEGLHSRLFQMEDLSRTAGKAKKEIDSFFEGVHACLLQMEDTSREKIRVAEAEHKMLFGPLELLAKM